MKDLLERYSKKMIHFFSNQPLGNVDTFFLKIPVNLFEDILVARLFEIGHYDLLRIGFGIGARQPQVTGGP